MQEILWIYAFICSFTFRYVTLRNVNKHGKKSKNFIQILHKKFSFQAVTMDFKLPHNLKAIRKKWKLNQTEFAQLLDSERVPISNYEIGKHTPGIHFLLKLQDLTGIQAKTLCYKLLQKDMIPEKPIESFTEPNMLASEPEAVYLTKSDLYNFHELVRRVHELEQIVTDLERRIKIKKN